MMSSVFSVSVTEALVRLDGKGQATTTYNVTNTSGRPLRGRAQLQPLGSTAATWLSVSGEAVRSFAVGETHQFIVKVAVPPAATGGTYSFRLDVVSVENPDEDFTQGQAVAVEVPAPAPPKPARWPIFLAVAAVVVVAGGLAFWILSRKAEVPPVVGKSLAEAIQALTDKQLGHREEEVVDKTGQFKPDEVVYQEPGAGEKAARGSAVLLRVQKGVAVPTLVGKTRDVASALLEQAGLTASETVVYETTVTPPPAPGDVVRQDPEAGKKAVPGSAVAIDVYESKTILVPNLVGLPQLQAIDQLRGLDLQGEVTPANPPTEGFALGQVVRHQPAFNQPAERGSKVTLEVKFQALPKVPTDLVGASESDARAKLLAVGLNASFKDAPSASGPTPAGHVLSHSPAAGTEMQPGSVVELILQPETIPFIGTWVNVDTNTRTITKVQIRRDGGQMAIHMWGKCHPTDCDWGEVTAPVSDAADGTVNISWDQPSGRKDQTLRMLPSGHLQVQTISPIWSATDEFNPRRFIIDRLPHEVIERPLIHIRPGR
jgi:beta-lactam-binding protein with PASTA domain